MIEEGEEDPQKDNSNETPEEEKYEEQTMYFQANESQDNNRKTFDYNAFQKLNSPTSGRKQSLKGNNLNNSLDRGRSIFSAAGL